MCLEAYALYSTRSSRFDSVLGLDSVKMFIPGTKRPRLDPAELFTKGKITLVEVDDILRKPSKEFRTLVWPTK